MKLGKADPRQLNSDWEWDGAGLILGAHGAIGHVYNRGTQGERDRRGRLIAAAPRLARELQALTDAVDRMHYGDADDATDADEQALAEAYENARAALAKAGV